MNKYDPEDIEQLMFHKSFEELLEEEKLYVLRHLDSQKDYEKMRATLLSVKEGAGFDEMLLPPPIIKERLLKLLEEKRERRGFWWFWNMVFPPNQPYLYRPLMQFATILVFVFGTIFTLNQWKDTKSEVAMVQEKQTQQKQDKIDVQSKNIEPSEQIESNVKETEIKQEYRDASLLENKTKEAVPSLNSTLNENKSLHLQDSDEDILKINASEDRYMDSDVDLKISKENQISEELTINKDVNFGDELEKKKSLGKESDLFSESLQENNAFSVEQLSAPASIQADKSIKRASMNVKTKSLSSDEEWIDLFYTAL